MGLATFWAFFRKLVRSPWLKPLVSMRQFAHLSLGTHINRVMGSRRYLKAVKTNGSKNCYRSLFCFFIVIIGQPLRLIFVHAAFWVFKAYGHWSRVCIFDILKNLGIFTLMPCWVLTVKQSQD
jgi:hypothetical protein